MMTPLGSLFLLTCGLLIEHASGVVELTDLNFFDYAKDKDVLLVDFYAPWCSDCKALDPDFENAAANLGTRSVDLAKVDCFGTGKGLCSTYGVRKWPTLKNFNRGQYTGDYTGGLSTAEIAGYITTVENSAHPSVVNPYAVAAPAASAALTPQAAAAVAQQCVARCKISRITNKQPCYARCKPKTFGKKVPLPQPVINEKSCAKCRQPQIAGKFSSRGKATDKKKRVKRDKLQRGYSGLPLVKERLLLNDYMDKHLKGFFKERKHPKGETGLSNTEEREMFGIYLKKDGSVINDDKRNMIQKAGPNSAKKGKSSIREPINEKRSSIPSPLNENTSASSTPLDDNYFSVPTLSDEKRSSIPRPFVEDESRTFEPRPAGEEFHSKVSQLKKK